jgi:hypothetical protein
MPAVVQNHLVVRELGTPWSSSIVDQGQGTDKTVVFWQDGNESARDLEARVLHGVQKIHRGKEWLSSAVIACNEHCDPQTVHTRYRLARRVLKTMHHPGPARLVLVLDKGGKRAIKAMVAMAKRLTRDISAANVALTIMVPS